jgi:hypothetical protein
MSDTRKQQTFRTVLSSPLLCDPERIFQFRNIVSMLLDIAQHLESLGSLVPAYREAVIAREWRLWRDELRKHLWSVVKDFRAFHRGDDFRARSYVVDPNVQRAYRLARAALHDVAGPSGRTIPARLLELIIDLLPDRSGPPPIERDWIYSSQAIYGRAMGYRGSRARLFESDLKHGTLAYFERNKGKPRYVLSDPQQHVEVKATVEVLNAARWKGKAKP